MISFLAVFIVSQDQPRAKTFNQLSQLSVFDLVQPNPTPDIEGDLGFFIDTTPTLPPKKKHRKEIAESPDRPAKKKHERKILKDESIFIEDDDDISISSSEDIDVLHALSHWGSQTDLQFDQPVRVHRRSDHDDFALLEATFYQDIFTEEKTTVDTPKQLPSVLDT